MNEGRFFPLLLPLGACRVCEGNAMRSLHVMPVKTRTKLTRQLNRLLVGCEGCGVVYQHPLPQADELAAYYAKEAGTETEGWDARTPADEADLAVTRGIKTVRSERYVQALELLAGLPETGTRKALDFGCGLGAFLDPLKERGWETFGIEPGPAAASVAGRHHTMIEEIPGDGSFDLVIVHHVAEHLHDPVTEFRRLAAASKPGGLIWVSVPNLGTLGSHGRWKYVVSDRHIFSYTAAGLTSVLAASGYAVLAHSDEPTWPTELTKAHDAYRRLMCLARRTDEPQPWPERPLELTLAALRAFGLTALDPSGRTTKDKPARAGVPRPGRSLASRLRRRLLGG